MRLICPNCGAQYEVDASAVPPAGRDVQCSNCGHAWFQQAEPEDAVRPEFFAPETETDDLDQAAPMMAQDDPVEDTSPAPMLQRRTVDDSVLSVLREEAEREAIARRADASTLEVQGDLGLPPPINVAHQLVPEPPEASELPGAPETATVLPSETEKRLAAIKGQPMTPPKPAARRDLLPDIEEINSSLSPSTVNARQSYADVNDFPDLIGRSSRRSGFRSGFVLMLVLAGLGTALYLMAPQISQQIPGSADTMTAYVAAVDAARVWLDGLIRQATGVLNGLTGNGGA